MPSIRPKDRVSLCHFSFSDGRRCITPISPGHPHFCFYHAEKESQSVAAEKLGRDLDYFFSGDYLSACDLSAALARLLAAVARGHVKPRAARTLAYLAQTLAQTIHLSQDEYINAFGTDAWRQAVRDSVRQNASRETEPPRPAPESQSATPPAPNPPANQAAPAAPPAQRSGRSSDRPAESHRASGQSLGRSPAPPQPQPAGQPTTPTTPSARPTPATQSVHQSTADEAPHQPAPQVLTTA